MPNSSIMIRRKKLIDSSKRPFRNNTKWNSIRRITLRYLPRSNKKVPKESSNPIRSTESPTLNLTTTIRTKAMEVTLMWATIFMLRIFREISKGIMTSGIDVLNLRFA